MADLLQRLKMADDMDSRDAAAEIERLRAALKEIADGPIDEYGHRSTALAALRIGEQKEPTDG